MRIGENSLRASLPAGHPGAARRICVARAPPAGASRRHGEISNSLPNHGDAPALQRNALLLPDDEKRGLTPRYGRSPACRWCSAKKRPRHPHICLYIHMTASRSIPSAEPARSFIPVIRPPVSRRAARSSPPRGMSDEWRLCPRGRRRQGADRALLCTLMRWGAPKENIKSSSWRRRRPRPRPRQVIAKYPDRLKSDLLVIPDGPQHPSGRLTIFYGARGGAGLASPSIPPPGMH